MILKERDKREHADSDLFSKAGAKAERQMAFYLHRAFLDDPEVYVLNDLRFEYDTGDVVQIDHLVLHRHGLVLVESKSVSTDVEVNEHGEWSRLWRGKRHGMPSPIQQAQLQVDFLRKGLNAYKEELVGKMLGHFQIGFTNCPIELLIAISDRGTITRRSDVPEVLKADQVADRICQIIKRHKKASSLLRQANPLTFNDSDGLYTFKDQEIAAISQWLLDHHCPRGSKAPEPPPLPKKRPDREELGLCVTCGEPTKILWGRYSYYWKCPSCDHNMPIKEYCPSCNQKMKIRKDGKRYFRYCDTCGVEEIYFQGAT